MPTDRQLPLSETELTDLTGALGGRSLDSALGMLAAVVSVPEVLPSQSWLSPLLAGSKLTHVEEVQRIAELIMRLNNFVSQALMDRSPRAFFPDVDDDEACRAFVNGYLDICARARVDPEEKSTVDQALTMLVGYARVSDQEMADAGAENAAGIRGEIRSGLPEIIGVMHAAWLVQRKL